MKKQKIKKVMVVESLLLTALMSYVQHGIQRASAFPLLG